MAKLTLTDTYIRNRPRPTKGNVIDYDNVTKGLAIRFTPRGVPTFLYCYGSSVAGGSARRMAVGPWSDSSGRSAASVIPKMRKRAGELAMMVAAQRDPYSEQQQAAVERKAAKEADKAARLREERDVTVGQLCDRYLAEHGPKLRPATLQSAARRLNRYLRPEWGTRKANSITRADVAALVKPLRAQGKAAEVVHVLSMVTGLYSFAVDDDELETITDNPARGLKKKLVSKAERPKPKDRALVTQREFRAFYLVTRHGRYMPADVAACLRLMMLTGCRPSEAAGIEWEEIDFHAKLWNKPADVPGRSKSRRADVVPLVDEAMEILTARRGNGSPYVFPSGRNRRADNGGGPGVLTENRLAASLREVAPRLARLGVASFTPHDLRRTVTTGLFDIDVSEYIVKRTLNHATRGVTDTHYNKSAFIRQRRAALEAWTAYLEDTIRGIAPDAPAIVIPFRKAG